jgi:hypothetical protein
MTGGYSKEIRRRFINRIITYANKLEEELCELIDADTPKTEE